MDPTPGVVTFADLLTPAGVLIAAATILSLVEVIKAGIPAIDRRVSGATLAFFLSGLLYVAAAATLVTPTPDAYLVVAFAWIGCATSAMGIRAGASHVGAVRSGEAALSAEAKAAERETIAEVVEEIANVDTTVTVSTLPPGGGTG